MDEAPKTSFRANLFTLRTLLIFAAGFALALLLARVLPGAGLFHPEGQVFTRDTFITYAGNVETNSIAIGTELGLGFGTMSDVWDGDLLNEVRGQAPGPMRVAARITYVVPKEGTVSAVFIRRPE